MRRLILPWLACCLLAVGAPSLAAEQTIAPASRPAPAPPSPEQIMAIPPALRELLQRRVIQPYGAREARVRALVELIFDPQGLALRYESTATHTVAEAYAQRSANCLSFTLLFLALAREAGIPARAQEIGQVLSWYQDRRSLYDFGHINVQIRVDGRVGTVDLDSSILMDRLGPHLIEDTRLFAHYYSNRGSELMTQDEYGAARAHFAQALKLDASLPSLWNNLGVLEARQGRDAAAASDYAQALRLRPDHIASLSNLINLRRRQGDHAAADSLLVRLEAVREADPFQQFLLGRQAENAADYDQALRHYRRAVSLYPSAHQFHFGLARVHFLLGQTRLAERELERARTLGPEQDQQRYQAKLEHLRRYERALGSRH